MANPPEPTQAVQDYLKAIHALGGADRTVSPLEIAARLQVRAPSVTGMLKRLAESGSIVYEARHGARLTEQGVAQARATLAPASTEFGMPDCAVATTPFPISR